jgi:hypothetical protein
LLGVLHACSVTERKGAPTKEHVLMTRSIVTGLLGLLSVVAMGILPTACQSGGVGDPCTPEDEYNPQFAGFKVTEENIESRSFQCQTRICLVNHFQGRVSCPLGQPPPKACSSPGDAACGTDGTCVEAATLAPDCDPEAADNGASTCAGYGGVCNAKKGSCECNQTADCPTGTFCDPDAKQCKSYVCHKAGNCQIPGADDNANKACCVPGTDTPVAAPTCGQCDSASNRDAEKAVYCSCRCGVAEGEPEDENFNFCECPSGFECSEIRKNVGLGDKQITGKYCIKQNSAFESEQSCGQVKGYFNSQQCKGISIGN